MLVSAVSMPSTGAHAGLKKAEDETIFQKKKTAYSEEGMLTARSGTQTQKNYLLKMGQ